METIKVNRHSEATKIEFSVQHGQGKNARQENVTLVIGKGGLTLGRHSEDFAVADCRVSSKHVFLVCSRNAVRFVDLGSRNGTYLNANRIESGELQIGSVLRIGRTTLVVMNIVTYANPDSFSLITTTQNPEHERTRLPYGFSGDVSTKSILQRLNK